MAGFGDSKSSTTKYREMSRTIVSRGASFSADTAGDERLEAIASSPIPPTDSALDRVASGVMARDTGT